MDFLIKKIIIAKAKKKLAKFTNLKIIGITGSYGKTTLKEALATILQENYLVLKTPENINTPLGVSRLILNELSPATEIFIVEMGAYHQGDIKALCDLTTPNIAVLTGINEAHLERFGSLENTIKTKFEIVEGAVPGGLVVLNADNRLVVENFPRYQQNHRLEFFTAKNHPLAEYQASRISFLEDGRGTSFTLKSKDGTIQNLRTSLLGEYSLGLIMACAIISKELGLTEGKLKEGIAKVSPLPHRLQPLLNPNGILVIDDSYNGNPDGVREALKVLARFKNRRKIYFTPGLAEIGKSTPEIHEEIGRSLAKVADLVILAKNSATPYLAKGLGALDFSEEKIIWFENLRAAYAALPKILQRGDVILFQNDWPDNYL